MRTISAIVFYARKRQPASLGHRHLLSDVAARRFYAFGRAEPVRVKLPEIQNPTFGISGENERFAIRPPDRARDHRHRDHATRRRCRRQVRSDVGHVEVAVEPHRVPADRHATNARRRPSGLRAGSTCTIGGAARVMARGAGPARGTAYKPRSPRGSSTGSRPAMMAVPSPDQAIPASAAGKSESFAAGPPTAETSMMRRLPISSCLRTNAT